MIDPNSVNVLWQYMVHADRQMLAAAATVPVENDDRDYHLSAGSVRKVLTHCYMAQQRWMARMTCSPAPAEATPTRDQLPALWADLHTTEVQFAAGQSPDALARVVHSLDRNGNPFSMPLGLCMLHVADHATYHRGQLNSLIKLAGGTPSGVMFFTFANR